jgi:hypothetical protein
MKKGNNTACPRSGDIVLYIYREIGGRVESEFEMHLAACAACTDEFAAVADTRYSVFEWKRTAFDPLTTPTFTVPRMTPAARRGWTATLQAWAEIVTIPAAAAAVLAVLLGVAMYFSGDDTSNGPSQAGAVREIPSAAEIRPDPLAVEPAEPERQTPIAAERPATPARPAAIRASQRTRASRHRPVNSDRPANDLAVAPVRVPAGAATPVLSQFPDSDDDTLRLIDLFDEVGG